MSYAGCDLIKVDCRPECLDSMVLVYSPDLIRGQIIRRSLISKGMTVHTCTSHFEVDEIDPHHFPLVAVLDLAHDISTELTFRSRIVSQYVDTTFVILTRPQESPILERTQPFNERHLPVPLDPQLILTCVEEIIKPLKTDDSGGSSDEADGNTGLQGKVAAHLRKGLRFCRLMINITAKKMFKGIFYLFAIQIGILIGFIFWCSSDLPDISLLSIYSPYQASRIYSYDNELLTELYVERRHYLPHSQIPDKIQNAVIAIEDLRFFKHHGIDPVRMIGAFYVDLKAGDYVQGGSTITQQLAKLIFLSPEKTITRKIKEILLSIQIERIYSKEEILGHYLNKAYFGSQSYGIEAAAWSYFGKSVDRIDISEAAILAGLMKAPTKYSPFKNPDLALKRRDIVLGRMFENGFISEEEFIKALSDPLPTRFYGNHWTAPYFVDFCRSHLKDAFGDRLYTSGIKVYTTLDSRMQQMAESVVAEGLDALKRQGAAGVEAALLAVELSTGKIKAMVGGSDYSTTQYNRVTQALRQPGSAFKPIVYLTALINGYSPETVLRDQRRTYRFNDGRPAWSPQNYNDLYYGNVAMDVALAKSLNSATLDLAQQVGLPDIIKTAKTLGVKSNIRQIYPSVLGASEMTLMELVYAYGVMATGYQLEPVFIDQIIDHDQAVLLQTKKKKQRVLDTGQVENIRTLLAAVVQKGTARKARQLNRPVYGKTGTSNDNADALFIGFDDKWAVGVWVGRDDNTPIGENMTGGRAALPIWMDFMRQIQTGR